MLPAVDGRAAQRVNPEVSRRRVLATAAAAGAVIAASPMLAACTKSSGDDAAPATSAIPDPASPRARAAEVESDLRREADEIMAAHPSTIALLAPARDAHAAHEAVLVGRTPAPRPTTPSSATPSMPTTSAADAVRALARRERSAARLHAANAGRATVEGSDARLIASVAAYAAAQSELLAAASLDSSS